MIRPERTLKALVSTAPYYNDRLRVVFVRVPKTGSTSVTSLPIWSDGSGAIGKPVHVIARYVSDNFVKQRRDHVWIGGVRHPEAWLRSLVGMCASDGFEISPFVNVFFADPRAPVTAINGDWRLAIESVIYTPMDWLEDDRVRIEPIKLEESWRYNEILGVDHFPRCNVARKRYEMDFDDEARQMMRQKFAREYALYE